ncbi:mCG148131 [Mus musculus]|jgi:hypothetical protein|uniref:Uncharacterized protein n=1 Tax=Mus musculus TaxID=10090 RepID=Q9D4Z8_MOUSE|nr:mCG148131 [Mus musculus]BAB30054.1 unnamed protein product [Mus musculus]
MAVQIQKLRTYGKLQSADKWKGFASPPSAEVAPKSKLLPLPPLTPNHTQLRATDSPGLTKRGETTQIFSSLARWGLLGLVPPESGICCSQLDKNLLQLGPILGKPLTEGADETSG